MYVTSW